MKNLNSIWYTLGFPTDNSNNFTNIPNPATMKKYFSYLFGLFLFFCAFTSSAQSGQFDVRFANQTIDCSDSTLYFDIEVKATSNLTTFNISHQNYRFSFTRELENPRIVQELGMSGTVTVAGATSFYDPHHLNGSLDTIVSYNVILTGGDGVPVNETSWQPVGRMALDIVDFSASAELKWHDHNPVNFPPTFVGEKYNGYLIEVIEGNYYSPALQLNLFCNTDAANDDLVLVPLNTPASHLLGNNDFMSSGISGFYLIANPTNGTITIAPNGAITYTPNMGFVGIDFARYEVCNLPTPTVLCFQADIYFIVGDPMLTQDQVDVCDDNGPTTLSATGANGGLLGLWTGYAPNVIDDETSMTPTLSALIPGTHNLAWTLNVNPPSSTPYIQPVTFQVHDVCVWPGDTDVSTVTDNADVLNLGLAFGATGTPRATQGIAWTGHIANDWFQATPMSNIDFKHMDTDGNGAVNFDDTLAITQNWGLSYIPARPAGGTGTAPLYAQVANYSPAMVVEIPIMLGESFAPASDVYGIAFSVQYDTAVVVPNSVHITYENSWLGTINQDMIGLSKDFYNNEEIQVGMTRNNGLSISGSGQIATLRLTIKDDIMFKNDYVFEVTVTPNKVINASEELLQIVGQTTSGIISDSTTSVVEHRIQKIKIYPNPANDILVVASDGQQKLGYILYDLLGRPVAQKQSEGETTTLNVANLKTGIYLLEIHSEKETTTKKVRIVR